MSLGRTLKVVHLLRCWVFLRYTKFIRIFQKSTSDLVFLGFLLERYCKISQFQGIMSRRILIKNLVYQPDIIDIRLQKYVQNEKCSNLARRIIRIALYITRNRLEKELNLYKADAVRPHQSVRLTEVSAL